MGQVLQYLGHAVETIFRTPIVTPTKFLDPIEVTKATEVEIIRNEGIAEGFNRNFVQGKKFGSGGWRKQMQPENGVAEAYFGLYGDAGHTTTGVDPFAHVFVDTLDALIPSYTDHVGAFDGGVVLNYRYPGQHRRAVEVSVVAGEAAMMTVDTIGAAEETATLATLVPSFSTKQPYVFAEVTTIEIDNVASTRVGGMTIALENGIHEDDYTLGDREYQNPLVTKRMDPTGTIDLTRVDPVIRSDFLGGAETRLELTITKGTDFVQYIIPAAVHDSKTQELRGRDPQQHSSSWRAYHDDVAGFAVEITVQNGQALVDA